MQGITSACRCRTWRKRASYIGLLGAVEEVPPLERKDNAFIDAVAGLKDAARQFMCRLGKTHIEAVDYFAPLSAAGF